MTIPTPHEQAQTLKQIAATLSHRWVAWPAAGPLAGALSSCHGLQLGHVPALSNIRVSCFDAAPQLLQAGTDGSEPRQAPRQATVVPGIRQHHPLMYLLAKYAQGTSICSSLNVLPACLSKAYDYWLMLTVA